MMSDSIAGIRLGVAQAGLKVADQDDLVVVELASGTRTAALFTQNTFRAAPVVVAERHLSRSIKVLPDCCSLIQVTPMPAPARWALLPRRSVVTPSLIWPR